MLYGMSSKHRHFCTLFDSGYLSRGLIMIESLIAHFPEAHVYVFAFDQLTYDVLTQMKLAQVTLVALSEFEDPELLRVKPTRGIGEYCWTSTPSTIRYCLQKFNLPSCTYVDADLCFYGSPEVLFQEMAVQSVLITPHWYTPKYDQTRTSGIYCVQFVTVCNTDEGLTVLNWWRERCLEWCYARFEDLGIKNTSMTGRRASRVFMYSNIEAEEWHHGIFSSTSQSIKWSGLIK
jgi:hypothetical protein